MLTVTTTTTAKILYADDDSDDRFLLNEYILSTGLNADIVNDYLPRLPVDFNSFPGIAIHGLSMVLESAIHGWHLHNPPDKAF